jgi:membrane protein DedA with SNARE-associated domain
MAAVLGGIVAFVEASRYGLLFVTTLFGSPIVMIAAGYLIHIHQLDFWAAYGTIVAADITGDVVWYWVGRTGARAFFMKYGTYFGVTEDIIERLERRFLKYHEWILIISKLTMGLGLAIGVLAVAGMMRVPFWRYLGINLSGELLWALIPIAIGYYYGNLTDFIPPGFRWIALVAGLAVVILVSRTAIRKLAKREW